MKTQVKKLSAIVAIVGFGFMITSCNWLTNKPEATTVTNENDSVEKNDSTKQKNDTNSIIPDSANSVKKDSVKPDQPSKVDTVAEDKR